MSGKAERLLPWAWAGLGAAVTTIIALNVDIGESQKLAIIQSIISVASIFIGFLGTALAIVLSFFDREIFRKLASKQTDKKLIRYILDPIYGLFSTVVICMTMLIWTDETVFIATSTLLGFSIAYSLAAMTRINRPIQNILDSVRNNE